MKFQTQLDALFPKLVESIQQLVAIPSVEDEYHPTLPFGQSVQDALTFTLSLAESLGMRAVNLDNMAGYAEIGSGEEMIGILGHLDVVPAGDAWTHDPFSGTISEGRIYGRGTGDDKGPTLAALYAMKALLDAGVPLDKRIRIIFGLNEETHWRSIAHYVAHEELPTLAIVPDSAFPVIYGEKGLLDFELVHPVADNLPDGGIVIESLEGGQRSNMVPDHAEAIIQATTPFRHILDAYADQYGIPFSIEALEDDRFRISVTGVSAHAARPWLGKNALAHLIHALDKIDLQIGDRANFIRVTSALIGLDLHGEHIGCALEDEPSGKLTLNLGVAKMDGESAVIRCNVRYPITKTYEEVTGGIQDAISYSRFTYRETGHKVPLYVDPESDFIRTLLEVYRECTGRDDAPLTMGGATYARSMPNAVSYGALFPERDSLAHQKDEYISLDDLRLTALIYTNALERLLK